jgi:leucyl aminopeptidase
MRRVTKKITNEAIELVVRLGKMPANILTPDQMVVEANELHDDIKVTDITQDELKEMGANLLLSVGEGSNEDSHMIVMKYFGAGNIIDKPIVLVGKGVTFDTGGISIKPSNNMHQMKMDMLGAASVMATIQACANLKLAINVIAVVPTVENAVSASATKPGDVFTGMAGISVEVLNTDAEGRLILADALTYVEQLNPEVVIDVATLTGAALYALGPYATPVIGNDQDLIDDLIASGEKSKDRAWQLPLWDEHTEQMEGQKGVADLRNISKKTGPGTITAAAFLSEFTHEYKWAHLDIAATGSDGDDPTGRSVKMMIDYIVSKV